MNSFGTFIAEEKKIIEYISRYGECGKVLDVGCGYGRMLKALSLVGIEATGVEINKAIVDSCRADGLNCIQADEFHASPQNYWDIILMVHIIEHFSPSECFAFIERYLDYLKVGGILIIATPVLTDYFYEDFDHIKPYLPLGITMVFGDNGAQVQFVSRNKLALLDLWYKKYFYRTTNAKSIYFEDSSFYLKIIKNIYKLLFFVSFGFLGKTDGWVGVFKKIK